MKFDFTERMRKSCCSLGLAFALSAAVATAAPAQEVQFADLPGVWQMRGYGKIFDISSHGLTIYDVTDVSCVRQTQDDLLKAQSNYDRFDRSGNAFTAFAAGGITRYAFDELAALPDRCRVASDQKLADPDLNFSALWHAFRENYAFFELRQARWEEVYTRFRPRISAATTEDELFEIFSQVLASLNDGHVGLTAGERDFSSGGHGELQDAWAAGQKIDDQKEAEKRYNETVRSFIADEILKGKARRGAEGLLMWGWAAPGVGYINVAQMYVEGDDPASGLPEQLAQVDEAMARALNDLRAAKALIVDARFNPGGHDAIALRIAGYLTSERRLAFTKKAVFNGGFTEPQPVYFDPQGRRQFTGPIYYLQSGSSASAAEIFSLAMMSLPHVTRVGTPTYGVLSDVLEKKLPNGWSLGLSNELYVAVDGNLYEGRGIPPHVTVATNTAKSFHERLRLDLDTTLALIAKARVSSR